MGFDIRKNGKNEKAEEFAKEMKERHEEARAALVKSQKEMKRQADRNRKEVEEYRVGDKVLISTKDFSMELMKRAMKKLTEKFIGPYMVKKIVSENAVELELPVSLRIHPVVNCYDLKLKGLSNKTTLVWSNTSELNRVPSTK